MTVDLAKFRGFQRGPRCGVAQALKLVDPQDAQDFVTGMLDPTCVGTLIAAELNRHLQLAGHDLEVGVKTLQRHRRRLVGSPGDACVCPVPERG